MKTHVCGGRPNLVRLPIDFHTVWPGDLSSTLYEGDPSLVKVAPVEVAQSLQLLLFQLHHLGKIDPGLLRYVPSAPRSLFLYFSISLFERRICCEALQVN